MTRRTMVLIPAGANRLCRGLTQVVRDTVPLAIVATGLYALTTQPLAAAPVSAAPVAKVPAVIQVDTAIVAKCKSDLAKRLNLRKQDISTVETRATVWPDASLGIPEIGKTYAQVETPGLKVILEARNTQYLYTTSTKSFKYGGPVALWSASMLYLKPVSNEPNLNSELYQCSLLGTNGVRVAEGVSAYYPQQDGFVIFTRRTSRSSHDLLLGNTKNAGAPIKLHSALAFGEAALKGTQDTWAAFTRPVLGSGWQILIAGIGPETAKPQTLAVPDGAQPGRIAWSGDKLLILASRGQMPTCFETTPGSDNPQWTAVPAYTFPGIKSYSLNKSEMLEITQIKTDGKPRVEVAGVWFTGNRNVFATINGLTLRGYDLLTLHGYDFNPVRYPFVWGELDGKLAAYTVDISTHEQIRGLHAACHDIKPFAQRPAQAPYTVVMSS